MTTSFSEQERIKDEMAIAAYPNHYAAGQEDGAAAPLGKMPPISRYTDKQEHRAYYLGWISKRWWRVFAT